MMRCFLLFTITVTTIIYLKWFKEHVDSSTLYPFLFIEIHSAQQFESFDSFLKWVKMETHGYAPGREKNKNPNKL